MAEIQKSDPKARRNALVIVAGGALLGAALITVGSEFRSDFEAWVTQNMHARVRLVTSVLMVLTTGPVLGIAGYLGHLGRRVVRAERYPAPGVRIIRHTRIIVGAAAVRRGRLIQTLAGVIGVAGVLAHLASAARVWPTDKSDHNAVLADIVW